MPARAASRSAASSDSNGSLTWATQVDSTGGEMCCSHCAAPAWSARTTCEQGQMASVERADAPLVPFPNSCNKLLPWCLPLAGSHLPLSASP